MVGDSSQVDANFVRMHGTAVALGNHAVLIIGPSGSGKSDLALRCLSLGHGPGWQGQPRLIGDDQVILSLSEDWAQREGGAKAEGGAQTEGGAQAEDRDDSEDSSLRNDPPRQSDQPLPEDIDGTAARRATIRISCPETIAGQLEIRGFGIVQVGHTTPVDATPANLRLIVRLGSGVSDRLPDPQEFETVLGQTIPAIRIDAFEASAAAKTMAALACLGRAGSLPA